jgi:20S proteasome subunit beta 3
VAMVGKDCVAIAADRRFGVQAMTLNTDFQKMFPMNDHTIIGLTGLGTDVQTLYTYFNFHSLVLLIIVCE